MDIMRYLLATVVVIAHINYLTGFNIPFPISSFEGVGGFFAISGFLMYPNYVRHNNLLKYTLQRAKRILPPYFLIVIVSALGLSAISSLGINKYYLSKGLFEYLCANLSFLNWIHPDLPGVFVGPEYITSAVNGSLWTMKVEWCLYFSVPIFVLLLNHLGQAKRSLLALCIIIISIAYRFILSEIYYSTGNEIFNILRRQIFGQLSFFYAGMLIYFIKDYFVKHLYLFLILGIALRILMSISSTCSIIIEPFAISVIVLSLSLLPYDFKLLRHRNNISYEMYLFHFPIIQLAIYIGTTELGVWTTMAFVLGTTVILSLCANIAINRWILKRSK